MLIVLRHRCSLTKAVREHHAHISVSFHKQLQSWTATALLALAELPLTLHIFTHTMVLEQCLHVAIKVCGPSLLPFVLLS